MNQINLTCLVAAPLEKVWSTVTDFEARPRWTTRVKEAQVLGGGPLQEGSRIGLKVGRDRFEAAVIEMRPPERLALLVTGLGFRVTHTYELSTARNGTTVTLTGDYQGLVGALVMRFMRGTARRDLADELGAVQRAAEASESSAPSEQVSERRHD